MAEEIERKFLIREDRWRPPPESGTRIRQGYLSTGPERVVRVRLAGDAAYLTIKGPTVGVRRLEFEYPIPPADAEVMLDRLCLSPLIAKTRYRVPWQGRIWEVDVFEGDNAGLTIAEVELPSVEAALVLPPWVGREVSDDPRYFNSNLAVRPYRLWRTDA
jgi:CYTH domain-containing protein